MRREVIARRRRLTVQSGVYYNVSRKTKRITHAWAFVMFWNTGGRPLYVEHVGFRWFTPHDDHEHEWRGEIHLDGPLELAVDWASRRVHTPLGSLMRAGVDPLSPVQPFAITTGERLWLGPMQPVLPAVSEIFAPVEEQLSDLKRLADAAELPPALGPLISLPQAEVFLPEDDPSDDSGTFLTAGH